MNMRMTITSVGPLLDQIAADAGSSPAALGALVSIPLIAWGVVSPLAHSLSVRLGLEGAVGWSLLVLGIGTVWRSLPGSPLNLWLGTALIGAALAVGNVLLPVLIRRDLGRRVPLAMGAYTALLGGMGAVAAGIVVPISHLKTADGELGWRMALLAMGALIPVALVLWTVVTRMSRAGPVGARRREAEPDPAPRAPAVVPHQPLPPAGRSPWRDPVAWSVTLYMACHSAVFYMIATWLAPVQASRGSTAAEAGVDVMLYQLASIGGSLVLPVVYRGRMRRSVPVIVPAVTGGTFVCIALLPIPSLPWILLGGLGSGVSIGIALMFVAVKAAEQASASALSGMAQSVGYLIAAAGPAAFGLLSDVSGGWLAPTALVLCFALAQLSFGIVLGRERRVFDGPGR